MTKVNVKICGLTRVEDAKLAASLGAWALGFIFYSKSARVVQPTQVRFIADALPPLSRPMLVGVFVNPSLEELKTVMNQVSLDFIQLHGHESEEFCRSVKAAFPEVGIIKAFRLGDGADGAGGDYRLIDSMSEDNFGGTGKTVDWTLVQQIGKTPLILAGGLTNLNVAQAIGMVYPFAVDVSSGVELSPGIKSEQKLKSFFQAVKGHYGTES